MRKNKRIWLVILASVLFVSGTACGGNKNVMPPNTEISDNNTSNPNEPKDNTGLNSDPKDESGNNQKSNDNTETPTRDSQEPKTDMKPGQGGETDSNQDKKPSVEPIYFEGSEREILNQKIALGKDNRYVDIAGDFSEHVQGVTDINNYDYLFRTNEVYYTAEDFADCSNTILKLAKNEIYARHGRMFLDKELYTYFLTRMWYEPKYTPEEFDDSCLNDCERANLKLLLELGA